MNKVNLCWVFSDGKKGHEIQSTTVAQALAEHVEVFHFTLKQPWLSFAPRRLPKFNLAIKWAANHPDLNLPAKLIVTTGRQAAAVGKHFKNLLLNQQPMCKHIHILNPKDQFNKYDWLLLPEHDNIKGANVITFRGSIHPYNRSWFEQEKDEFYSQFLAVFLGNPNKKYFKRDFAEEITQIRKHFGNLPVFFCGSPRLSGKVRKQIHSIALTSDKVWLSPKDGNNPYQSLLRNAKKFFVTSDSINMINEACASQSPVSILARDFAPSPKHFRFLDSLTTRLVGIDSLNATVDKTQQTNISLILNKLM